MAYHLYQTEAFVLGGRNSGEAHRMLYLLTKELGLVRAHARSVREERSKLRYGLQNFSKSHITLVRGKDMWRITGAVQMDDHYHNFAIDNEKNLVLQKISNLLVHTLYGEEKNDELYDLFERGITFLEQSVLSEEETHSFEEIFVLRIFSVLGYVGDGVEIKQYAKGRIFHKDELRILPQARRNIVGTINEALLASRT